MINYRILTNYLVPFLNDDGETIDQLLEKYIEAIENKNFEPFRLVFGRFAGVKLVLNQFTTEVAQQLSLNIALQLQKVPLPVEVTSPTKKQSEGVLITNMTIRAQDIENVEDIKPIIDDREVPNSTSQLLTRSLLLTTQLS